ncbi:MAG: transcriptional regulator, partial [bacterium]|nr:transcriptional regulator [bacterium]
MRTKHDAPAKTLGPQAAGLVTGLYERQQTLFSLAEVEKVTGLKPKSARNLVARLVDRGVATRLKPGLFILVPFELGRERDYLGNPYVVARELVGGRDYYLSHASAMDLHGMVTQPQLIVYVTTPRPVRPRDVLGTEFRFVRCKREHLFGTVKQWVSKTEQVVASDLERTVIDGLKQPEHCGGISESAKGLWMRRQDIDPSRLVDYALRLDVG